MIDWVSENGDILRLAQDINIVGRDPSLLILTGFPGRLRCLITEHRPTRV
jgi:hypothetical protein